MTFHSSRGRGRRLRASGSFDIGYLALCRYASTRHRLPRPLPGGSPMGADRPMFHASPPGGSLPIREFVCALPLPLPMLRRPSASSFRPAPRRPPLSNSAPRFQPPLGLVLLHRRYWHNQSVSLPFTFLFSQAGRLQQAIPATHMTDDIYQRATALSRVEEETADIATIPKLEGCVA